MVSKSISIEEAKAHVLKLFPSIDTESLEITSPRTDTYNCIAYAAGDQSKWWWPDPIGIAYWPKGVVRTENLIAFQMAFESLGYALTADEEFNPEYERIAIFHKNGKPTHAARQIDEIHWTSKLGRNFDIFHDLRGVEGETYGEVSLIMERKKPI